MNTQEFKHFAFEEMKALYHGDIDFIDFDELWSDMEITDQLEMANKFAEKQIVDTMRNVKDAMQQRYDVQSGN